MTRWYTYASSALLWVCAGTGAFAQDTGAAAADPQGVFSRAKDFYRAGSYDSVIVTIREFLKAHGKDPAAEYLVPLIMEALARKGDCTTLKRLFDLYERKYPSSAFLPRACYLHGFS